MFKVPWLMGCAYEGDENREQAVAIGMRLAVSPLKSGKDSWECAKELYKKRNEAKGLFWRFEGQLLESSSAWTS